MILRIILLISSLIFCTIISAQTLGEKTPNAKAPSEKIVSAQIPSAQTSSAQTFLLNSPLLKSHPTARVKIGLAILTDAFNALGFNVEFRYRPDKRSITEASKGLADGDFARIAAIVELYPNLVVVPESLGETKIVAFSLGNDIDLSHYQIVQHQHRIGYLSGWANASGLLKDYPNKVPVAEYDVLFKFLLHKRVDLVLYNKVAGEKILRNMQVYDYQISASLLSNATFLVLNKKHTALTQQLAVEIKRAKAKYAQLNKKE